VYNPGLYKLMSSDLYNVGDARVECTNLVFDTISMVVIDVALCHMHLNMRATITLEDGETYLHNRGE
jgi:hypothetical protein